MPVCIYILAEVFDKLGNEVGARRRMFAAAYRYSSRTINARVSGQSFQSDTIELHDRGGAESERPIWLKEILYLFNCGVELPETVLCLLTSLLVRIRYQFSFECLTVSVLRRHGLFLF